MANVYWPMNKLHMELCEGSRFERRRACSKLKKLGQNPTAILSDYLHRYRHGQ